MLNARRTIFLIGPSWAWERVRPKPYRRHKVDRSTKPWKPQPIPERDSDRLRRQAEEFRKATRSQVDALNAKGRVALKAA
jgi:hypothetical protein